MLFSLVDAPHGQLCRGHFQPVRIFLSAGNKRELFFFGIPHLYLQKQFNLRARYLDGEAYAILCLQGSEAAELGVGVVGDGQGGAGQGFIGYFQQHVVGRENP